MLINTMILQLFLVLNLTVTLRLAMYILHYYTMALFLGILVSLANPVCFQLWHTHTHIQACTHACMHTFMHTHTHTVSHVAMYLLWQGCSLQSSQWTAPLHDWGRTWEQCTQHQEHHPRTGSPDSSLCIITMATVGDKKPLYLSPSAQ